MGTITSRKRKDGSVVAPLRSVSGAKGAQFIKNPASSIESGFLEQASRRESAFMRGIRAFISLGSICMGGALLQSSLQTMEGGSMRIVLLVAVAVALIPVAAPAEELIGGKLRVVSVELLAESQAVIELDNGSSGTEILWVDCALGEWGYNGEEAGFPVKPDEKSQVIAYRACKDASNTSPLVQQPGSWRLCKARNGGLFGVSLGPTPGPGRVYVQGAG